MVKIDSFLTKISWFNVYRVNEKPFAKSIAQMAQSRICLIIFSFGSPVRWTVRSVLLLLLVVHPHRGPELSNGLRLRLQLEFQPERSAFLGPPGASDVWVFGPGLQTGHPLLGAFGAKRLQWYPKLGGTGLGHQFVSWASWRWSWKLVLKNK